MNWQLVPQREAQLQSTQKIEYQAHIMILHAVHNILSGRLVTMVHGNEGEKMYEN